MMSTYYCQHPGCRRTFEVDVPLDGPAKGVPTRCEDHRVVQPPRIIMQWREKTTHLVRFFRKEFGFEQTFCGLDIAHDLRYVAPEGTMLTCMGCIAEAPP